MVVHEKSVLYMLIPLLRLHAMKLVGPDLILKSGISNFMAFNVRSCTHIFKLMFDD